MNAADVLDMFAEQPRQLALPEPPDTRSMSSAVMTKRAFWMGLADEAYYAEQIGNAEWLLARNEVESWTNQELMRIDDLYRDFYGVR